MKNIQTGGRGPAAALFLIPAVLFFFAGCKGKGGPGAAGSEAEVPVFAVNTSTAVQGQIQDYLPLSGDIISGSTVDVYSDVAGLVVRRYVELGSRVTRGTAIVSVDPSKPGMNYVPAVATAPVGGTVVALPAEVGMTVSQAVSLARISGGDALEIKLFVAERFISKIAMNQTCEITLDAWPGETFRGSVTEISPIVDPASRTMEFKLNVDNPGAKLKAGMFAKVKVITEQKNDIVKIPASAMVQRFGEIYVFVLEDFSPEETEADKDPQKKQGFFASLFGKFFGKKQEAEEAEKAPPPKQYIARKRNITPGISIDGILEIRQGLKPNEEFVVRGQGLLEDGARINVIERVNPLSGQEAL
jgi:multidrug efflux pump subunit AcrA (membrane-fusion protein)